METSTKKLELVAKAIFGSLDGIKVVGADKSLLTFNDFINSEELKNVHSGFQSKTSITERMFDIAWVVGSDVYVKYKIDGLNFIKKERIGSFLDSAGICECSVFEIGFIIDARTTYDQGEKNREIWRQQDWKTLISPFEVN